MQPAPDAPLPVLSSDDLGQIVAFVAAHKWIPLAAVVVGLLVRLLKSDVPITPTIPARWRGMAAILLGIVAGVLNKVVQGTSWSVALTGGVAAGVTAIVSHELLVEGARDGRDVGVAKGSSGEGPAGPSAGRPGGDPPAGGAAVAQPGPRGTNFVRRVGMSSPSA